MLLRFDPFRDIERASKRITARAEVSRLMPTGQATTTWCT
jgi:hypothetical protein